MAPLLVEGAETAREADHRQVAGADVAHLQLGLGQIIGRVPRRLPQHPERDRQRQCQEDDERGHPEGAARAGDECGASRTDLVSGRAGRVVGGSVAGPGTAPVRDLGDVVERRAG